MKIFIAGASGAIGSQLVPQLVARGHEIIGTTRSAAKTGALRALGAEATTSLPCCARVASQVEIRPAHCCSSRSCRKLAASG